MSKGFFSNIDLTEYIEKEIQEQSKMKGKIRNKQLRKNESYQDEKTEEETIK